jgi:hypothetical protein
VTFIRSLLHLRKKKKVKEFRNHNGENFIGVVKKIKNLGFSRASITLRERFLQEIDDVLMVAMNDDDV